jgi:hypothetical protein
MLSDEYSKHLIENKESAQFNLALMPEKYLVGFSAPIDQFLLVYEVAVKEKNDEVARAALRYLKKTLYFLCEENENDLFVDQILRKLAAIACAAIEHENIIEFDSAISAYKEIVFSYKNNFKISYLKKFDQYFFSIVKLAISNDRFILFKDRSLGI